MGKPTRARRRPRNRPRLIRRINLRKAAFALPSLFTVSSIFCGFLAIGLVQNTPTPAQFYQAGLAIFFGLFFDMADGRVARLTRTQSEFGVQLDSLADVITFGVAPATVLYSWGFANHGLGGAILGFAYVAAGALRLARFNVLAAHAPHSMRYFIGLPIPIAAGTLLSLIMFHQRAFGTPPRHHGDIAVLVLVLAYLMVSNVRYRTFKDVHPSPLAFAILLSAVALFAVVAIVVQPTFALLAFFAVYLASGLIESVATFARQPPRPQAPSPPAPSGPGESSV